MHAIKMIYDIMFSDPLMGFLSGLVIGMVFGIIFEKLR